jgi:ATP-dependent DNA ligase
MTEPLETRRGLLETKVLPELKDPVRYSGVLDAGLSDLIASVKAQGFEGLVGKHRRSMYVGWPPRLRQPAKTLGTVR